jgi:hypothetical protein
LVSDSVLLGVIPTSRVVKLDMMSTPKQNFDLIIVIMEPHTSLGEGMNYYDVPVSLVSF